MEETQLNMELTELYKKHRKSNWNDLLNGLLLIAICYVLLGTDLIITQENISWVAGISAMIAGIGGGYIGKAYKAWGSSVE